MGSRTSSGATIAVSKLVSFSVNFTQRNTVSHPSVVSYGLPDTHPLTMEISPTRWTTSVASRGFVPLHCQQQAYMNRHLFCFEPYVHPHTTSSALINSPSAFYLLTMSTRQKVWNTSTTLLLSVTLHRREQTYTHNFHFLSKPYVHLRTVSSALINSSLDIHLLAINTPLTMRNTSVTSLLNVAHHHQWKASTHIYLFFSKPYIAPYTTLIMFLKCRSDIYMTTRLIRETMS